MNTTTSRNNIFTLGNLITAFICAAILMLAVNLSSNASTSTYRPETTTPVTLPSTPLNSDVEIGEALMDGKIIPNTSGGRAVN